MSKAGRFEPFIYIQTNILPSQARDKHRESSKTGAVFFRSHFWMLLLSGEKRWAFVLPPPPPAHALDASYEGSSSSGSAEQQQRQQQQRQQRQQRAFLYEDRAHQSFAGDLFKPDFRCVHVRAVVERAFCSSTGADTRAYSDSLSEMQSAFGLLLLPAPAAIS